MTTLPAGLIVADQLPVYDLGIDHPFARDRQRPLFDLMRRHGWVERSPSVLPLDPDIADRTLLELAHAPRYIGAVEQLSRSAPEDLTADELELGAIHGLGTGDNPIAKGQHDAAAAIVGATATCVRAVLERRVHSAFQPGGGLHHAMPERASGFCIYNDLVVAIRLARSLGCQRVLYVDFDVHHGDGVELAFRGDPDVLTLSYHEDPRVRFPGTGRVEEVGSAHRDGWPTCANFPLATGTADESFIATIDATLGPLARRFEPDLIISQHGCDPHVLDPLAELHVTTRGLHHAALRTREIADELCGGRWIATGGGGYRPVAVIPRAWSLVWTALARLEPPAGSLDPEWRDHWLPRAAEGIPDRWFDLPSDDPRHRDAARVNLETLHAFRTRQKL